MRFSLNTPAPAQRMWAQIVCGLALGVATLAGCERDSRRAGVGQADPRPRAGDAQPDPQRGMQLIQSYGCGGCHTIDGVPNARGKVGPPLEGVAKRSYLGGVVPNTPANMRSWIRVPQDFEPGSAMPNLGVSEADAADIVAFLYSR